MTLDYVVYLMQKTKRRPNSVDELDAVIKDILEVGIDRATVEYHYMVACNEKVIKQRGKKANEIKSCDRLRNEWYEHVHRNGVQVPITGLLSQIAEPELRPGIWKLLPQGSFLLNLNLTLAKPLITRDDNPFYVIENPVAKDFVFRQPMMRSTSWKGLLRYAMRLQRKTDLRKQPDDEVIIRLFGPEKKKDEQNADLQSGRLTFFTTFFNSTDLEVLNPHNRERKVGTQPIAIECIRKGAQGRFYIFYTPLDLLSQTDRWHETLVDLRVTVETLRYLMLEVGFSAKRTSGYGVITGKELDGTLQVKMDGELSTSRFNDFDELKGICEEIGGQYDE